MAGTGVRYGRAWLFHLTMIFERSVVSACRQTNSSSSWWSNTHGGAFHKKWCNGRPTPSSHICQSSIGSTILIRSFSIDRTVKGVEIPAVDWGCVESGIYPSATRLTPLWGREQSRGKGEFQHGSFGSPFPLGIGQLDSPCIGLAPSVARLEGSDSASYYWTPPYLRRQQWWSEMKSIVDRSMLNCL